MDYDAMEVLFYVRQKTDGWDAAFAFRLEIGVKIFAYLSSTTFQGGSHAKVASTQNLDGHTVVWHIPY